MFFLPVFELARLLEDVNTWRKECIADAPVEAKGKFAYAKIHQDPVLYRWPHFADWSHFGIFALFPPLLVSGHQSP